MYPAIAVELSPSYRKDAVNYVRIFPDGEIQATYEPRGPALDTLFAS